MFDKDGYPTDETLEKIKNWDCIGVGGQKMIDLMDFIEDTWWLKGWGWKKKGREYSISTGGWSGNEDIIQAMKSNRIFWSLCWESSNRGGHYTFEIPNIRK